MHARIPLLPAAVATAVALSACSSSAAGSDPSPAPAAPSSRPGPVAGGLGPVGVTEAVAAAAGAFLASLTAEQRDQVRYDAADPVLREWSYFPSYMDR